MKRVSPPRAAAPAVALFAFLFCVAAAAAPLRAGPQARDSWLGIYFNGRKIGYSSFRIEGSTWKGKPAIRTESTGVMKLEIFGNSVSQDVRSLSIADSAWTPLHQEYNISSNGATTEVTADYQPGKIACTLKSGGATSTRVVPIPAGAKLIGDSSNPTQGLNLKPGQKGTFYYLNPVTLALEQIHLEVKGREPVTLAGRKYVALKSIATLPLGTLTSWETADGDLLKSEMSLGIVMFPEPKAAAMSLTTKMPVFAAAGIAPASGGASASYKPPRDFAVATAVTVDRPINNSRKVRSLDITVRGINNPALVISDSRQRAAQVANGAYRYRISVTGFDPAKSATLPISNSALRPYLTSAPYLETDSPAIREAAEKLRGSETNAYRVAQSINSWVHETMTPDYTIGVPRSCSDILKKPRGVCRDFATLFAGIARAAGIPTRVAGGIVYADGRFFYHAWVECWVGKWIVLDPTLKADFVDATHVKFAQGDVTQMFGAANVVGRLKIKVNAVN